MPDGVYELKLPYDRPPLSQNDRYANPQHRASTIAKVVQTMRWTIRAKQLPALPRARVELHYFPARAGRRDPINLTATLKALEDALVREGVLPDDDPRYLDPTMPLIHPPRPAGPGVWVRVVNLSHPHVLAPRATPLPDPVPTRGRRR